MKHKVILNVKIGSKKLRVVCKDVTGSDPCMWQIQRPYRVFFWTDMYGPFSSIQSALHHSKEFLGGES